jgi:hypothetical protein
MPSRLMPVALLACVVVTAAGCSYTPPSRLDPDRILHMAGEEAGLINAPRERLTRQLNIANRETESGKPAEARKTLAQACETLEKASDTAFTDQQRLAGWVSLSELARAADDKPFANAALDRALASLDALNPQQARCEYVLGIEREVRALRGDAAAAKLLVTAGDWAMEIPDQPTRRGAFFAFSNELFRCNDYDGARTVLRKDQDAAWRSDALTVLADRARYELAAANGRSSFGVVTELMPAAKSPMSTMTAAPTTSPSSGSEVSVKSMPSSFGKSLDFRTNYLRR